MQEALCSEYGSGSLNEKEFEYGSDSLKEKHQSDKISDRFIKNRLFSDKKSFNEGFKQSFIVDQHQPREFDSLSLEQVFLALIMYKALRYYDEDFEIFLNKNPKIKFIVNHIEYNNNKLTVYFKKKF